MGCLSGIVVFAIGIVLLVAGAANPDNHDPTLIVIGLLLMVAAIPIYLWIDHIKTERDRDRWTRGSGGPINPSQGH
jgi:hypothetical protein